MSSETDPRLPSLHLTAFGACTANVAGEAPPADVLWRKHLALLVYLALSPNHTRSRDHLVGLLWPEKSEARARHSLNEAVRRLRGSLGQDRLQSTGETLTLADTGLTIDVLEFERVAETDGTRALDYMTGDFLEGFSVDDAPEFEAWVSSQRERYRERGGMLLLETGKEALNSSEYSEAADVARRAIALKPYSEPAVSLLMNALALAGDRTGSLHEYTEFCSRIERELNEAPSRDLQDLSERIRTQRWHRVSAQYADTEPPLVGRRPIQESSFTILSEAMAGGVRGLAINADPGMGRTRLVAECVARWTLRGGLAVVAHPLESDHDAPWSTLRALARAGLASAPGVAATDPERLAVLACLIPEIISASPPREPRDTAEVGAALGALLSAVAEENPLLIAVDDAHYADPATLQGLYAAFTQLNDLPSALIISSLQHVQDAPLELVRLRGEIGRGIPGGAVRLHPLEDDDLRALVHGLATWCEDDEELDRLTRRVIFETGNSPFLAVTLLRGLRHAITLREDVAQWPKQNTTMESPLPISVPDLARMAIVANVTALDHEARRLLTVASVLDLALDPELLARLTDVPLQQVKEHLGALERHHLVSFDGQRYAFFAPLIAHVVKVEFLTSGELRSIRERAIAELETRSDLEARVLHAELLAAVRPGKDAGDAAAQVVRDANAAAARRTARRALRAVERALGNAPDKDLEILETLRAELTPP
jgi:DNA-binding SARP family transcriptional activator